MNTTQGLNSYCAASGNNANESYESKVVGCKTKTNSPKDPKKFRRARGNCSGPKNINKFVNKKYPFHIKHNPLCEEWIQTK